MNTHEEPQKKSGGFYCEEDADFSGLNHIGVLGALVDICHREYEHARRISDNRYEEEVGIYFAGYKDAMRLIRDVVGDYLDFVDAMKDEQEPERVGYIIAGVTLDDLMDWIEKL